MTRERGSGPSALVIGIGTEHRHDDRLGLDVVRALRFLIAERARVVESSGDPTELLDLWDGEERVLVVDAVRSGAAPGTRRVLPIVGEVTGPSSATSSHGLSLGEAIALGRALGRMPRQMTLYTIEAGDLTVGSGLTSAVTESVDRVVAALAAELEGSTVGSSTGRSEGSSDA